MKNSDIRDAVSKLIDLVENGRGSLAKNFAALELALDRLALAAHFIEFDFDDKDYPDPPDLDEGSVRELVITQFPKAIGFYNIPDDITMKTDSFEILTGDAVDDLADIYEDLKTVAWAW